MKKVMIVAALVCAVFATSCRETETKEVIIEKEVVVDRADNEDKGGILERAAKEVDKEVNEEIDEEIDKIGNDD